MNASPSTRTLGRVGRRPLIVIGAAVVAGVLILGVLVAVSGQRLERIGYYADWNAANRGFTIGELHDNGAAQRLTRLMWAFGATSPDGLCHIPEDNHDQPWELYQRRYSADESVSGEADSYAQPLAGGLHQLLRLRELHPDLGASLSLGGWNWSTHFSEAARTQESREAFVSSCVDLWLRGDLPVLGEEPQGGPGAAAGVFDGIDLDWEWPSGGGHPDNTEHADDPANFPLLVAEFRRQLDALERETGQEYTLSVSLPGGAGAAESYDGAVFEHVDFATVQGYDFSGPWMERTAHHSNLYAPESGPEAHSVDAAVRRYLDQGAPAEKLVMGLPAFARGWQGVEPADAGRGQPAEGPADDDYDGPTKAFADAEELQGERHLDEEAGAYWVYDGDEWWTYDNADVVDLKGAYVAERGLGGLMVWNLDMDPEGELVRAMDESLRG
ncbi:chitinase [Nocardiopsis sp. Huas11]|uniref:glycoside hydrolase family 18 protein n=1 Tax=Nocardiopsis sp. Huas11 TaxID=2183912 RepID=UPI000EAFB406|nr:glycoside hydrolase family 18 protein [Nocardiopsis sp. Huas11]RKS10057.1 chitinase [Nocardiopsis sp. Huas11]